MDSNVDEHRIFKITPILEGLSATSIAEIERAIKQLKNWKFSANDGMLAEIYKNGRNLLFHKLCAILF